MSSPQIIYRDNVFVNFTNNTITAEVAGYESISFRGLNNDQAIPHGGILTSITGLASVITARISNSDITLFGSERAHAFTPGVTIKVIGPEITQDGYQIRLVEEAPDGPATSLAFNSFPPDIALQSTENYEAAVKKHEAAAAKYREAAALRDQGGKNDNPEGAEGLDVQPVLVLGDTYDVWLTIHNNLNPPTTLEPESPHSYYLNDGVVYNNSHYPDSIPPGGGEQWNAGKFWNKGLWPDGTEGVVAYRLPGDAKQLLVIYFDCPYWTSTNTVSMAVYVQGTSINSSLVKAMSYVGSTTSITIPIVINGKDYSLSVGTERLDEAKRFYIDFYFKYE